MDLENLTVDQVNAALKVGGYDLKAIDREFLGYTVTGDKAQYVLDFGGGDSRLVLVENVSGVGLVADF